MRKVFKYSNNKHIIDRTTKSRKNYKSILFYSEGWGMGGIERFIMNEVESLDRQKFHFDIFCTHDWSEKYDSEISSLGGKRYVVFHGRKPNLIFRLFKSIKQWSELLKANEFDIVHINTMNGTGFLYAYVAKRCGVSMRIVHSHNSDFGVGNRFVKSCVHWFCCHFFSSSSTINLACSHAAGQFLFQDRPFRIIRNGIDTSKFTFDVQKRKSIRRRLKIDDDVILIGSVARLSDTKNPLFQVELLSRLRQLGANFHLLLVGDGELHADILQSAKRNNIQKYIHLAGNVDDPLPFLSALDIFTLPSLFEGLPLSLVEATACGLLCVVSDSIQLEESDFPNVFSLPIQNVEVWVDKLMSVRNTSDYFGIDDRLMIGEKTFPHEYDQKRMANTLLRVYSGEMLEDND